MKKVIERVEKLLRLAAPSSGGTEAERAAAALEAARLVSEHQLRVGEAPPPPPLPIRQPPPRPRPRQQQPQNGGYGFNPTLRPLDPRSGWVRSRAATDGVCVDPSCGDVIVEGESVWMRIRGFEIEYLHLGGDCNW